MAKTIRSLILTNDQMLRAIQQRDPGADRSFVYGVTSTAVYCLPSCPSRAARERNLRFFMDFYSAEAAGFRACKRCRPRQTLAERDLIESLARQIIRGEKVAPAVSHLATAMAISETTARKRFTRWLNISPSALADAAKHQTFKTALRRGTTVTEAIFEAGFGSTRGAFERYQRLGMTPSSYREGGAGEKIVFAVRDTSYGKILMAATERGVCFCQFGDSAQELHQALQHEFPNAALSESIYSNSEQLDLWLAALQNHLDHSAARPDMPLDLRGSIFQIRVWRFLLSIPQGATASYSEVAKAIGKPRAHRAVATACGANRVAVLIPCHRVLRGDGSQGGYRWGVPRKQALLIRERVDAQAPADG
ncbi:MAG: methylated-DNA--[protein]-cysteine S-methyltransferase [Pseudomonadaceae bacterium]|nr:methylated-DNA--[protein]-cysteine S-methyltransferase [Pseudomonadaceae bacterium]